MNLTDIFEDKEKLKQEILKATFLVTLYENFKNGWKEQALYFYANEFELINGEVKAKFTRPVNDPSGGTTFVLDKEAEKDFNKKVFQTVKKNDGNYDKDASLFKWLLDGNLIQDNHYQSLIKIKDMRNRIVHELDDYIYQGFPEEISAMIKELMDIREYSSKRWFIEVELPTDGIYEYNEENKPIIPEEVYSSSDLYFSALYDVLFK